ncbi:hypothetical protein [Bacillus paramycoides]|uniref:hypothetical protein n=1 Tax=Bacillus paramycoides TaxID=2026194 RepID=UPI002E22F1CC
MEGLQLLYNKESDKCIAIAIHSKSVVVGRNDNPISFVKIYAGSIKNKEVAISNMQGEFQFYNGVCGVITLKFITPDGEIYTKKYDSKSVLKIIKLDNEN